MGYSANDAAQPGYDLYFTLRYVAGYAARDQHHRSHADPYSPWTPSRAEVQAQHVIDALLCPVLPEVQLARERSRLEAKLFGHSNGSSLGSFFPDN